MYQRVDGHHDTEHMAGSRDVSPAESRSASCYTIPLDQQQDEAPESYLLNFIKPLDNVGLSDNLLQDLNENDDLPQDRKEPVVATRPKDEQRPERNPWTPGFLARMPWLGLLAIELNILCTIVAVIILVVSNNSEIGHWNTNLQPSVWLSATSTVANLSLTLALTEGLTVAFWRDAAQGTTLKDLHLYADGASLFTAISILFRGMKNPKGFAAALACILTTLSAFRGPIVQRASIVTSVSIPTTGNMSLIVAQELDINNQPLGFLTGNSIQNQLGVSYLSKEFTDIVQNFASRNVISINNSYDCGNSCNTTVKGFGFQPTCVTGILPFNGDSAHIGPDGVYVFNTVLNYAYNISTELSNQNNTQMTLNSTYLNGGLTSNNISTHNCTLDRVIVEYPVVITGQTISLLGDYSLNNYSESNEVDFLSERSGDNGEMEAVGTIVGGYGFYLSPLLSSHSLLAFESAPGQLSNWSLQTTGMNANQYMALGTEWTINDQTTWADPMDDMLNQINELAFRTAVQVGIDHPEGGTAQNIPYSGARMTTIYQSDYRLMAIAVVLNFLALISLIPIYHGWWELGRNSSLSILETAKAFGAPLLKDLDDNATVAQILKQVGKTKVGYGEVNVSGRASGEFRIARKGVRGRLQIVEEERAKKPRVGSVFGSA